MSSFLRSLSPLAIAGFVLLAIVIASLIAVYVFLIRNTRHKPVQVEQAQAAVEPAEKPRPNFTVGFAGNNTPEVPEGTEVVVLRAGRGDFMFDLVVDGEHARQVVAVYVPRGFEFTDAIYATFNSFALTYQITDPANYPELAREHVGVYKFVGIKRTTIERDERMGRRSVISLPVVVRLTVIHLTEHHDMAG